MKHTSCIQDGPSRDDRARDGAVLVNTFCGSITRIRDSLGSAGPYLNCSPCPECEEEIEAQRKEGRWG